ncbi:MAG: Gfo/Idh/MocA family oxidoreductase [Candidatus Anammoximicrobium sp.]|nr:Gfo/Idh/MocA family oxidoreductase [Candidatus Anammoximicrobium sp.]
MEKVGFALVGYGAWGSHHARVIDEGSQTRLMAIAERAEANRAEARARHPQAVVVADYRELLGLDDIEVVDVVLPSHLHHEVGIAVLQAGKHLLMEKPMALTVGQCRDLVESAQAAGRQLAVGHEFRYSPLWGRVKELVDAGAIGDPQYALIELWRNPYRLGSDGWRYDIRRVGNWILEEPIHFFDLARWYFSGEGDPVSVYARAKARDAQHPELQDNFSALVDFPGGRYAVISQTLSAFEHHQTAKLTGSQGALWASWSGAMDRTFHPTFFLKHFDGQQVVDVPVPAASGEVYELAEEIAGMAEAARTGRPPRVTGKDGLWSVAMCLKAQESVDTGAAVEF